MTPTSKQSFAMGLIYPLADALQMQLVLRCKGKHYRVHGSQDFVVMVGDDQSLPFRLEIKASTVNVEKEWAWVLAHVGGSLWLYLVADKVYHEVYCALLDGGKIGLNPTSAKLFEGMTLERRADAFSKGVVAAFSRDVDDITWKKQDAQPDRVDAGPPVQPEDLSGATDTGQRVSPPGS